MVANESAAVSQMVRMTPNADAVAAAARISALPEDVSRTNLRKGERRESVNVDSWGMQRRGRASVAAGASRGKRKCQK